MFKDAIVKDGKINFIINEPFAALYEIGLGNPKEWLLGQDSNLQPSGYKRPEISLGLGLSHRPSRLRGDGAPGASPGPFRGTSVRSSLCTFPTRQGRLGLGSGLPASHPAKGRLP